ncbi:MAG TPA: 3-phosphoshikimate 1-carboxyvinyltransferase [Candidatus Limnocylindria bacterium]|jgi:3-phosphoshikimate 1-carboxyvinyltransferase|nr:3-phosphoshikimate 1-carboxyvinyltransferase [Candidatus Limnocylindria bacterium]
MLPSLIEIVPPGPAGRAVIAIPGSKSITNRALILAALAQGEVVLQGALWSEDTQVMVECLRKLGFSVNVEPDPSEEANRTIRVLGAGGNIPAGGSISAPLELFVGNAGTAARFLTAFLCLGQGCYRLSGIPRMHERPQAALVAALQELGYRVDTVNDRLPLVVHGAGPRPGRCRVSVSESSQFASALLLGSRQGGWSIEIDGANPDELPYVEMTRQLIEAFPNRGGTFAIEPDTSSGSYFWAASTLLGGGRVQVTDWPQTHWQFDTRFPQYLPLPAVISRERDLGDSIMTAIVLAPMAPRPTVFTDLGRLRVQECERVLALKTELRKCGARVEEVADTLTVHPSQLHGAEIETYNDHRMAMCFATLGLKVPGIRIRNPACVKKTFPNYFRKLAAPPPHGLGAGVLDALGGERLAWEKLGAE